MTRMDISLANNTPYNVRYLSNRGSDWASGDDYPIDSALNANSGNTKVIQSMGCPRAGTETEHWGWLNFRAEVPGFPGFYKYFYIYARQQDSGHCNDYGIGKAKAEGDPLDLGTNRIGTSSYTSDTSNAGSPKLECTLNVHDLDWSL